MNVTPGEATMTINIRHTESYTHTSIRNMIDPLLLKYTSEIVEWSEGSLMITPEDHPTIQKYKKITEEIAGYTELEKEHGSTDGAKLPASTTLILHQPTDAHIHSKGEYTTIDELEKVYTIYKRFIVES